MAGVLAQNGQRRISTLRTGTFGRGLVFRKHRSGNFPEAAFPFVIRLLLLNLHHRHSVADLDSIDFVRVLCRRNIEIVAIAKQPFAGRRKILHVY